MVSLDYIAGVDEAGRGPLAGPVVAAAVILPNNFAHELKDSKAIQPKTREKLYSIILASAVDIGVGVVSPKIIDELDIRKSTLFAMRTAVLSLSVKPSKILIDGVDTIPGLDIEQIPIVKGDTFIPAIEAASIVAKVLRDEIMTALSKIFPAYLFDKHKGYPTRLHTDLLKKLGRTPFHRVSFNSNF